MREKYLKKKVKTTVDLNKSYNTHISYGLYESYFKRPLDFVLSLCAIIICWPVMLIIALLVRIKLGTPVIFSQMRPGLNEKVFKLHKFRTMIDARDDEGYLLSDELRLTPFGKKLRSTSLDELPELFDILIGNLSIVGPRPQLVRDLVFMSKRHRQRHNVMPGLTGLAQVNGRNAIDWEKKLDYDIEYVNEITFFNDIRIMLKTIFKVFKRENITEEGQATALDYGDYLLNSGKITKLEYDEKQEEAEMIIKVETK